MHATVKHGHTDEALGSFGAVMEEFEVRDALEAVLSTKPEMLAANGNGL